MGLKDLWISWRVSRILSKYPHTIRYRVKDGVVFLHGKVGSYNEYVDIGLKIGSIRGVEGVVNNIEWDGSPEKPIKRGGEESSNGVSEEVLGEYDVVVIGAGVVGSMIARELSRYLVRVALVEKNPDVAQGTTKANNGLIHSGIEEPLGKLKTKLCVRGNMLYDEIARELNVRFRRVGGLWLITPRSLPKLKGKIPDGIYSFILRYILPTLIKLKALILGVPGVKVIRDRDEVLRLEPNVIKDFVAAVQVPTIGIIEPYELAIALVENAVDNGVDAYFETEVIGFRKEGDRVVAVATNRGILKAKFVVNAAGLHADEVAELAGAREYTIHPRKGTLILFDKSLSGYVSHEVAEVELPRPKRTKGGCINPTISGNIIWGPTAIEVPDKEDNSVSGEEVALIFQKFGKLVPGFPRKAIRLFAGVRSATFTEDFIIRPAKWVKGFIHVAGIQSPGLAAAPAIAKLVIEILRREGLKLVPKKNFKPFREISERFGELPLDKRDELIREDPRWGRIVCQCELVTEAEIIEAIKRMRRIGVKTVTLDGVKFRTRAMMGRCQGSFCRARIASIIARECNIPIWEVGLRDGASKLGIGDVKVLLRYRSDAVG